MNVGRIKNITNVAMFAAVMAVLGAIPTIPLSISPVPITFQTIGVYLSGSILGIRLGPKYAALSQIVFLLLVMAGLPQLSGGRGGIGVILGPSGGFIIS